MLFEKRTAVAHNAVLARQRRYFARTMHYGKFDPVNVQKWVYRGFWDR